MNGTKVVIKKIIQPFSHSEEAKRIHRELRILKHLDHENVIHLLDVFTTANDLKFFQEIYFVLPYAGNNLADCMQVIANKGFKFNENQIRGIIYQTLRGLRYIHSAGIVHRDLKPANLAIQVKLDKIDLKILDFGLARQQNHEMTPKVVTQFYQAPEIFLSKRYNQAADIWSVGCIMAELMTGQPLFMGLNERDTLIEIMNICQLPQTLKDLLSPYTTSTVAIDLVEQMLRLNPDFRPTAVEAVDHPYLWTFDPISEPKAEPFLDPYNEMNLTLEKWKSVIWDEMQAKSSNN